MTQFLGNTPLKCTCGRGKTYQKIWPAHVRIQVIGVVDVSMAQLLPRLLLQKLFKLQIRFLLELRVDTIPTLDLPTISSSVVHMQRALRKGFCTHRVEKGALIHMNIIIRVLFKLIQRGAFNDGVCYT
jgi:hypothetical protein